MPCHSHRQNPHPAHAVSKRGGHVAGTRDHPHPRGLSAAQGGDRLPVDQEARGSRRAHPRVAPLRRHLRELRVRRRQERAGDGRSSASTRSKRSSPARASSTPRRSRPTSSAWAPRSRCRTWRAATCCSTRIVGSAEADPTDSTGSPTSLPWDAPSWAARSATRSRCRSRKGTMKFKIIAIERA